MRDTEFFGSVFIAIIIIGMYTGFTYISDESESIRLHYHEIQIGTNKVNEDILSKIDSNTTGKEKLEIIKISCSKAFPEKLEVKKYGYHYSSSDCVSENVNKILKIVKEN